MDVAATGGTAGNRTSRTAKKDWREKFLAELADSGNVTLACKAGGIGRTLAYSEKEANADFAQRWEEALDQSVEVLEAEAFRRAVKGVRKPIFHGGEQIAQVTEYSDTLLIFLTKAAKPEKYRERSEVRLNVPELDRLIEAELARVAGRGEAADVGPAPPDADAGSDG